MLEINVDGGELMAIPTENNQGDETFRGEQEEKGRFLVDRFNPRRFERYGQSIAVEN